MKRMKVMWPISLFLFIYLLSISIDSESITLQLESRNSAPSIAHLFGTDWLGRDMFFRTLKALQLSITVGLLTAVLSTIISFLLAIIATFHRKIDFVISWLIDVCLSLPHLVTLLLISFVVGGGMKGVIIGLVLTHWPNLTRILRIEMLQLKQSTYVKFSERLGKRFWWRALHHYLPHVLPHLLVGFTVIFPHAILHEAAITFLGFGLPQDMPAIGVILSESMQYLSTGMWWLAFFPGAMLCIIILLLQSSATRWKKILVKDHTYETTTSI